MSNHKGLRAGGLVGLLVGLALVTGSAQAQVVSTEKPASILIFPKVTNTSNTVIHVTNTSNMPVFARCFYVDGANWQVVDFNLALTRQQPTHWLVSRGRPVNPGDDIGGLDPGPIPPVPPGFAGFLVCVQTDTEDGFPDGGNSLKGEATVGEVTLGGGLISKYNAIGIPAVGEVSADNTLKLDGVEYAACPAGAHVNFGPEGGPDEVIDGLGWGPSTLSTNLTFIPCSMDFERLIPSRISLAFNFRNEFENVTSTTTAVDCWRSFTIFDLLGNGVAFFDDLSGYAQVTSTPAVGGPTIGVLGVANVLRSDRNQNVTSAATNLHFFGTTDDSVIELTEQ